MCGICGVADPTGAVDSEILERMAATLRHRGPDDDGFYVSAPCGGPAVGLGFRRLSIIDVSGGAQPISNEDGSVWVILNGEIYNFAELRSTLEAQGHVFRTRSDTEVIVHLYEELGPGCVEHLRGMFALAVWDERRRRLLLARDRFGKKPLYYCERNGQLLFASELKALLEHPSCPRDLDLEALERYLAFEYVPTPLSIFAEVKKLPGGHRLVWQDGRSTIEEYWDLPLEEPAQRSEDEFAEELRHHLREAVRLRLVSDVPLGAFLSGGIDSSTVVAFMSELVPGYVKTFSIGFSERSFDESLHARRVAAHFGTDHHEEIFTPAVMLEILPQVLGGLDEPFADASVLPTFLLSRFTRGSVTVALGGDGSDELLAGYPTFPAEAVARRYPFRRALHEHLVQLLAARLPVSTNDFSLDFRIKRFLRGVLDAPPTRHQLWLGSFSPAEQTTLALWNRAGDPYRDVRELYARRDDRDWVNRLIYLYAKTYLQDDILVKVDRASMLSSLEVRAPFLDHVLVDFLARVPPNLKLRGLTGKHLLKRAMGDRLPAGISGRRKKGFGIPVAEWLKTSLREPLLDALSADRLQRQGLFDAREVERIVREHLDGRRDHRKQLWTLFVFQLWYASYVEAPAASSGTRAAPRHELRLRHET